MVLFTDLDGTLIEYGTYSFEKAVPAVSLLKERDIPLVLCSSKTKREIEHYRGRLGNVHPFISENGGGIFIPKGYFGELPPVPGHRAEEHDGYSLIRLGARYEDLRKALAELRGEGFSVTGFGDMTAAEISRATRLSIEEAEMAKERDFDEPFFFEGGENDLRRLLDAIREKGFNSTQGHILHILGDSDKGKAVHILNAIYRRENTGITTVGIGDSLNDLPMLEEVDVPVIVQKPDGSYDPRVETPRLIRADGIGPDGWNRAVLALLRK